jgi:hypothetical protein
LADIIDIKSRNPLLGTWRTCDGFTDFQYTVSASGGEIIVSGTDVSDGENAEVRDVVWNEERGTLRFVAYIPSTGRTIKYQFRQAPAPGRASVTYTLTEQETWELV